jgi:peptide/nickel transport system permease protein
MAQVNIKEMDNSSVVVTRKKISKSMEIWIRMRQSKSAIIGMGIFSIILLVALFANYLVDYETQVIAVNLANRLQPPSRAHILGTDSMGRDMLVRLIYGTRISLLVALSAVVLSVVCGTLLGSIAAYYGGKLETIIMRFVDVFASIPNLLMAITIATALGQSLFNMILAIGITGIPSLTRVVRATILTVKDQEFVEAGKALGGKRWQILTYHLLPNSLAPIIVQGTLRIASAILATTSLSFLGIGIKPPMPEWGNMLSGGREFLRNAPHITLFPGMAIMITILAVNLMGDGLRDALDPKLRR